MQQADKKEETSDCKDDPIVEFPAMSTNISPGGDIDSKKSNDDDSVDLLAPSQPSQPLKETHDTSDIAQMLRTILQHSNECFE